METYTFIETWVTSLVADITGSATTIVVAGLGLVALIVGAMFLIGLGKKVVKKAA